MTIRHVTILSLMMVCHSLCGQSEADDPPKKRHVRILVMGERPMPAYKEEKGMWIEVDPDFLQIPPTLMELDAPGATVSGGSAGADDRSVGFSLNQVFRLDHYRGPETLTFTLKRQHVTDDRPVKATAGLAAFLHPLVIIGADPGSDGWSRPRVAVVDISDQALPGGAGMVINHSKWPVRVSFGDVIKDQTTGTAKLLPRTKTPGAVAVKIEMRTREGMVTLFSNRHLLAADERLLLFVDDTRSPVPNVPPLVVRFATDSIKLPVDKNKKDP